MDRDGNPDFDAGIHVGFAERFAFLGHVGHGLTVLIGDGATRLLHDESRARRILVQRARARRGGGSGSDLRDRHGSGGGEEQTKDGFFHFVFRVTRVTLCHWLFQNSGDSNWPDASPQQRCPETGVRRNLAYQDPTLADAALSSDRASAASKSMRPQPGGAG